MRAAAAYRPLPTRCMSGYLEREETWTAWRLPCDQGAHGRQRWSWVGGGSRPKSDTLMSEVSAPASSDLLAEGRGGQRREFRSVAAPAPNGTGADACCSGRARSLLRFGIAQG